MCIEPIRKRTILGHLIFQSLYWFTNEFVFISRPSQPRIDRKLPNVDLVTISETAPHPVVVHMSRAQGASCCNHIYIYNSKPIAT